MIWLLGVICLVHTVQSSLPALAEVMSRTRWCMGEGAHCPVNLPFDFPSCCKPFICTVVPRTRKPTMFLKFTDYKDYRCLLPPTKTPSGQEVVNKSDLIWPSSEPESKEYENNTVSIEFKTDNNNNSASVGSESTEDVLNNSIVIKSNENDSVVDNQYDSLSVNDSESVESQTTTKSQNARNSDSSDIQVKHIVKRSTESNKKSSRSKTSSSFESHTTSSEVSDASQLTKEADYYNVSSQSESNEMSELKERERGTQNSSASYDASFVNETVSQVSDIPNMSEHFDDTKTSNSNNLTTVEDNTLLHPNDSSSLQTKELSKMGSVEGSEEDWHSSEMHLDTRPFLRKVVTVPPFSLSRNVKTIQLNESIETSGE